MSSYARAIIKYPEAIFLLYLIQLLGGTSSPQKDGGDGLSASIVQTYWSNSLWSLEFVVPGSLTPASPGIVYSHSVGGGIVTAKCGIIWQNCPCRTTWPMLNYIQIEDLDSTSDRAPTKRFFRSDASSCPYLDSSALFRSEIPFCFVDPDVLPYRHLATQGAGDSIFQPWQGRGLLWLHFYLLSKDIPDALPKYPYPIWMTAKLRLFLNDCTNWTKLRHTLPELEGRRLMQARNSRLGTPSNNDFLEFVGDRVVNLMCALLVAKDSFSPDQQVVVDRLISKNDTLARLAYQLNLERYAELDSPEARKVADWTTRVPWTPPKVLADLFEAYAGAVYEEYGWDFTKNWLSTLFRPLIEKANEDYLDCAMVIPRYPHKGTYVTHEQLSDLTVQLRFNDFLQSRAVKFAATAEPALLVLPKSTKFVFGANGDIATDCNMVEIAVHLVKFWICEIFMTLYPHNRNALYKAAHLVSSITLLVTNSWTLGSLGSILRLCSCFDWNDPDFSIFERPLRSPSSKNREGSRETLFRGKLAQALYAVIGWYYSQDAKSAEKWGISWLIPLVVRAYDLIAQEPGFKPSFPYGMGGMDPYISVLVDMGRGPEVPVVTTQDELEERLTAIVLECKEKRGRIFYTGEDAKKLYRR